MTTTHVGFETPPTRHLQLVQWDFAVRGPTNLLESVRLDFDLKAFLLHILMQFRGG